MKHFICFVALMGFLSAQAQELSSQQLLEKSKRKKTAGWILLTAGGALMVGGAITSANAEHTLEDSFDGAGALALGVASGTASIFFFARAGKLKRRAKAMAFSGFQTIDYALGYRALQHVVGVKITL